MNIKNVMRRKRPNSKTFTRVKKFAVTLTQHMWFCELEHVKYHDFTIQHFF